MALVSYSDSEGSEDEKPQTAAEDNGSSRPTQRPSNFAVDKSNPRKIQVKLQEAKLEASSIVGAPGEEPAPKRRRVGGEGTLSGFNSILPAPKRDLPPQNGSNSTKGQPRKVFSLKTGAERGFDRDSDAELKQLFAEQHADAQTDDTNGANTEPSASAWRSSSGSTSVSIPSKMGSQTMFKPLSVARKPPKKKPATNPAKEPRTQTSAPEYTASGEIPTPAPKVSLFSTATVLPNPKQSAASTTDYQPVVYNAVEENAPDPSPDFLDETQPSAQVDDIRHSNIQVPTGPQSLDSVASDLHLSASARRQLFGRKSGASTNAVNVINFNTDKEYATNEVLRASGEQIQHNPVRGPSSGKHSLKQLVSMAAGQKDALEESFAAGRQNKKEASSKYGCVSQQRKTMMSSAPANKMMSSARQEDPSLTVNSHQRNTAPTSTDGLGLRISSQPNSQNGVEGPKSQTQAPTPATALSASVKDPEPAASKRQSGKPKSKRVLVQRDRNRMKCTRCMINKRGCDGGPPQCESCRKSNQTCEWVGPGVTRRALESQIADGKIHRPRRLQHVSTGQASEKQISDRTMKSDRARRKVTSKTDVNNQGRTQGGFALARGEYEEHLLEPQENMEILDEEEPIEDDKDGNIFDKTTKMYEEYKSAEGGIADQWAGEANSKLQLNWQDDPTHLSHYSHGDTSGVGFLSTMEKKLGMELSNQTYQPHKQLAMRTDPVPIQDWENDGTGPIGNGAGAGFWPGTEVHDAGMGASEAQMDEGSQAPDINWSEWVNEDYDDEGYFHFS